MSNPVHRSLLGVLLLQEPVLVQLLLMYGLLGRTHRVDKLMTLLSKVRLRAACVFETKLAHLWS